MPVQWNFMDHSMQVPSVRYFMGFNWIYHYELSVSAIYHLGFLKGIPYIPFSFPTHHLPLINLYSSWNTISPDHPTKWSILPSQMISCHLPRLKKRQVRYIQLKFQNFPHWVLDLIPYLNICSSYICIYHYIYIYTIVYILYPSFPWNFSRIWTLLMCLNHFCLK